MSERFIPREKTTHFPSIWGELENLHEYAVKERFTTSQLLDRIEHYGAMLIDPDVSTRAKQDLKTIVDCLDFEVSMRAKEATRAIEDHEIFKQRRTDNV